MTFRAVATCFSGEASSPAAKALAAKLAKGRDAQERLRGFGGEERGG